MSKILCFGSLNLDYVYKMPHFVQAGETLSSDKMEMNCGGKGLNQAIAAARAGAKVYHAGKVGTDGAVLTEMLKSSGVDTSFVKVSDGVSGHAIIQVDTGGQNCIILYGGSNLEITYDEIESVMSNFGRGDLLILQNEINGLDRIIPTAKDRGMFVMLNPSPINDDITKLPLDLVDMLIFNEVEGRALALEDQEDKILDILAKRYPKCRLLMTLGSRGCIYRFENITARQGIYKTNVVDTTAAGDTFMGYLAAFFCEGRPLEESLNLASKAAAIAVSKAGAAQSIPTINEVLETELQMA